MRDQSQINSLTSLPQIYIMPTTCSTTRFDNAWIIYVGRDKAPDTTNSQSIRRPYRVATSCLLAGRHLLVNGNINEYYWRTFIRMTFIIHIHHTNISSDGVVDKIAARFFRVATISVYYNHISSQYCHNYIGNTQFQHKTQYLIRQNCLSARNAHAFNCNPVPGDRDHIGQPTKDGHRSQSPKSRPLIT